MNWEKYRGSWTFMNFELKLIGVLEFYMGIGFLLYSGYGNTHF